MPLIRLCILEEVIQWHGTICEMGTSKYATLLDSCKNIRQWMWEALYKPHKPSLTTNLHNSFKHTWVFAFIRVISPYPEYSPLSCLLMDVSPFFLPPAQVSPSSWKLCNQFSPWWSGLRLHPAVYSYNCTHLQVQAVGGLAGGKW